jgi:hypothetical protein
MGVVQGVLVSVDPSVHGRSKDSRACVCGCIWKLVRLEEGKSRRFE